MYMNIAQQARGIDPLLDSVFSFLRRKTDFFSGPPGSTDGPEIAAGKVMEVLNKHKGLVVKDNAEKKRKEEKALADKMKKEALKLKKKLAEDEKKKAEKEAAEASTVDDDGVLEVGAEGFDLDAVKADAKVESTVPPPAPMDVEKEEPKPPKKEGEEEEEEEDKTPPPLGNGGTVEGKYVWSQTFADVTLHVTVPPGTKGRDLNIEIKKNSLKIGIKGQAPLCDAKLHATIIMDDSFWTLEDGKLVVINLQKFNAMEWWNCVCTGDPAINTQKVVPENSKISDLDGDTRQTVEKMMFDQRQKALNLPTSEEAKKMEILEKFKREHPEMDFSKAKFT
jgi:hypothetical protein